MMFTRIFTVVFLFCSTIVKPKASSVLNLISFKETSLARRLVPNTDELNEIIDRFLDSISRFFKSKHENSTSIVGLYQPFVSNEQQKKTVSGILRTSKAHFMNLESLRRVDNAYIYANEEDSIQVVTKLTLNPLQVMFDRYDLIIGKLHATGAINMSVDSPQVYLSLTVSVAQNLSLPLVFACAGTVDELSLSVAEMHLSFSGLLGDDVLCDQLFASFSSYFESVVKRHFESMLALQFEVALRTDDYVCSTMVLCDDCSFYAADF